MNVVFVIISGIFTKTEEVKESELLELSSFDTPIGDPVCESMLELTSVTE